VLVGVLIRNEGSPVSNDAYSCPLPLVENWLQVPVEAGELDYVK